jgi:hypothetical protein
VWADARQLAVVGDIEELDELLLCLLGKGVAVGVAGPGVEALLGEVRALWRDEENAVVRCGGYGRWGDAVLAKDVLQTDFELRNNIFC